MSEASDAKTNKMLGRVVLIFFGVLVVGVGAAIFFFNR